MRHLYFVWCIAKSMVLYNKRTFVSIHLSALEALRVERMQKNDLLDGIALGKKQLRAVMNTINSNIEMGTVINAGPFLYMLLKEGNPEHHMFAHPCSIRLLGES